MLNDPIMNCGPGSSCMGGICGAGGGTSVEDEELSAGAGGGASSARTMRCSASPSSTLYALSGWSGLSTLPWWISRCRAIGMFSASTMRCCSWATERLAGTRSVKSGLLCFRAFTCNVSSAAAMLSARERRATQQTADAHRARLKSDSAMGLIRSTILMGGERVRSQLQQARVCEG